MRFLKVFLMMLLTILTMVHGTKVIYAHNPRKSELIATGNILIIPGEKNKCKDSRTPDKTGKTCEKLKICEKYL